MKPFHERAKDQPTQPGPTRDAWRERRLKNPIPPGPVPWQDPHLGTARPTHDVSQGSANHATDQAGKAATTVRDPVRIVNQITPDAESVRRELRDGLLADEARIHPKFFYDATGCALFEAICLLDEYYPTRTEAAICEQYRNVMAAHLPKAAQWVDLGCGDGMKSRPWLATLAVRRYLGVDIAAEWLHDTLDSLQRTMPQMTCQGVVTDFTQQLDLHATLDECRPGATIFFYPGSSIGNFTQVDALHFLRQIRAHALADDALLIGVDLVKDPARIEAAYNDALGVTAAFNRNALRVANRAIDSNFDPIAFDHVAHFEAREARIEMRLRARSTQKVNIGERLRVFERGETILTEYSHKYSREGFGALLDQAGFPRQECWTDVAADFAVFIARP